MSAKAAKMKGRSIKNLRKDWEDVKLTIMHQVCKQKFIQNDYLKQRLINTGQELLVCEMSYDKFWGVVNGQGENHLGKILMSIRDEIVNNQERNI